MPFINERRRLRNLDNSLGDFNWPFFIPDRRGMPTSYNPGENNHDKKTVKHYQRRARKLENWWKDISKTFRDLEGEIHQERIKRVDDGFKSLREILAKDTFTCNEVEKAIQNVVYGIRGVQYNSLKGQPAVNKYYPAE